MLAIAPSARFRARLPVPAPASGAGTDTDEPAPGAFAGMDVRKLSGAELAMLWRMTRHAAASGLKTSARAPETALAPDAGARTPEPEPSGPDPAPPPRRHRRTDAALFGPPRARRRFARRPRLNGFHLSA